MAHEYSFEVRTEGGKLIASSNVGDKTFKVNDKGVQNHGFFTNGSTSMPQVAHLTGQPVQFTLKDNGKVVLVQTANPRKFGTGSYGFHVSWNPGCHFQFVLGKSKTIPFEFADDMRKSGLATLKNNWTYQCQIVDNAPVVDAAVTAVSADAQAAIDAINAM